MIFESAPLEGAWIIEPEAFGDERGQFARTFCRNEFAEHGIETDFPQANVSTNYAAGTLRGIHFQLPPHEEGKLVRCSRGAIYDAIVDLRPSSASFGEAFGLELNAKNGVQLFVPRGFGHAFLTLADNTEVTYLMSEFYKPVAGSGYRYDDPAFDIAWPRDVDVIAQKDLDLKPFEPQAHRELWAEDAADSTVD